MILFYFNIRLNERVIDNYGNWNARYGVIIRPYTKKPPFGFNGKDIGVIVKPIFTY